MYGDHEEVKRNLEAWINNTRQQYLQKNLQKLMEAENDGTTTVCMCNQIRNHLSNIHNFNNNYERA